MRGCPWRRGPVGVRRSRAGRRATGFADGAALRTGRRVWALQGREGGAVQAADTPGLACPPTFANPRPQPYRAVCEDPRSPKRVPQSVCPQSVCPEGTGLRGSRGRRR
jgi:hypothetical protein